jgi:hypothetical protein
LKTRQSDELKAPSLRKLKKNISKYIGLRRPLSVVMLYGCWVITVRLLALTFITYFTSSPTSHFQDITDAFSSNEVTLMGLAAFLFVALWCGLYPLTSTRPRDVLNREQIERGFLSGFVQGAFHAGGLILVFVLCGVYRYLGYFIQFGEAPLELANVLLRMAILCILTYSEAFIFHHKVAKQLEGIFPTSLVASLVALCFCGVKVLQFDLGIMHLVTLFLISVSIYYRNLSRNELENRFSKGAGFWAAVLIIFNPLLSLPIFGNEFQGLLWFKYQPGTQSSTLTRLITGGVGGPISSFTFQLLLIIDIGRSILRIRSR